MPHSVAVLEPPGQTSCEKTLVADRSTQNQTNVLLRLATSVRHNGGAGNVATDVLPDRPIGSEKLARRSANRTNSFNNRTSQPRWKRTATHPLTAPLRRTTRWRRYWGISISPTGLPMPACSGRSMSGGRVSPLMSAGMACEINCWDGLQNCKSRRPRLPTVSRPKA